MAFQCSGVFLTRAINSNRFIALSTSCFAVEVLVPISDAPFLKQVRRKDTGMGMSGYPPQQKSRR